ncbi:signal peptidase II [Patescibacteria group bacterium]|nr:signal peptidase II [Patescibacteria group bacterium]MBU1075046.1 signal peptidase II [Patescibacteria group bacterium]MBU1952346.1 signal peptidase II [Patescibacteria group bacterium]
MEKESRQFIVVSIGFFFLFIIDRITKWWAFHALSEEGPLNFLSVFRLELYMNEGIIFSIPLYQPLTYIVTVAIISAVAFFLFGAFKKRNMNLVISLSLIAVGSFSNFLDRIYHGAIIDFVNLRFLPVFNLADCLIIVGAIMLIFKTSSLRKKNYEKVH